MRATLPAYHHKRFGGLFTCDAMKEEYPDSPHRIERQKKGQIRTFEVRGDAFHHELILFSYEAKITRRASVVVRWETRMVRTLVREYREQECALYPFWHDQVEPSENGVSRWRVENQQPAWLEDSGHCMEC